MHSLPMHRELVVTHSIEENKPTFFVKTERALTVANLLLLLVGLMGYRHQSMPRYTGTDAR